MSDIPAWKLDLIRRRQMQGEEERRKQAEKDDYLAKLPPWKRALVLQKKKEAAAKGVLTTSEAGVNRTESADKWERAAKQLAAFQPRPGPEQQTPTTTTSDVDTPKATPSWRKAVTEPKTLSSASSASSSNVPLWKRSLAERKPAQNEPSPRQISTSSSSESDDVENEGFSPSVTLAAWRKAEKSVAPAWKQAAAPPSEKLPLWRAAASKPMVDPTPQTSDKPPAPQQSPVESSPSPSQTTATNPPEKSDVPASNVASTLPSWKQGLLASRSRASSFPNKRQLVQPASAEEDNTPNWIRELRLKKKQKEQQQQKQEEVKEEDKPEPTEQVKPTPVLQKPPTSKPEVVNSSTKQEDPPTKLVEREGVIHRPPVFQQKDKWANVSEDDPEFQKLPPWKKAMIQRRRKDIEKRTKPPQPEPVPQSPTEKLQKADMFLAAWTTSRQSITSNQVGKEETNEPAKETKKETTSPDNVPSWLKEVRLRKTPAGNNLKVQVSSPVHIPSPPRSPQMESEEEELECTAIDDEESEEEVEQPKSILKRVPTPMKGVSLPDNNCGGGGGGGMYNHVYNYMNKVIICSLSLSLSFSLSFLSFTVATASLFQ